MFILRQSSENCCDKKSARLIRDLSQKMGIKRSILLLTSKTCKIPFTCGLLNPVVFLPVNFRSWSLERLTSVMVHEIAHIKRKDNLTYCLSRIICSIFWYVPFIWVAFRCYLAEQEKVCDLYVINMGTAAANYARDVVDIVRFAKRSYLITAMQSTIGKKGSVLKRRVLSILNLNKIDTQVNKKCRVKTLVFCMLCVMPFLAFTPSMIQEKRKDAKILFSKEVSLDPVYGIWVNTNYTGKSGLLPVKLSIEPDGTGAGYQNVSITQPAYLLHHRIHEAWVDRKGDLWIKSIETHSYMLAEWYVLSRISDSGTVLERTKSLNKFPDRIEPVFTIYSNDYVKYFRK